MSDEAEPMTKRQLQIGVMATELVRLTISGQSAEGSYHLAQIAINDPCATETLAMICEAVLGLSSGLLRQGCLTNEDACQTLDDVHATLEAEYILHGVDLNTEWKNS